MMIFMKPAVVFHRIVPCVAHLYCSALSRALRQAAVNHRRFATGLRQYFRRCPYPVIISIPLIDYSLLSHLFFEQDNYLRRTNPLSEKQNEHGCNTTVLQPAKNFAA
jgi:hypothetical protein